MRIGEGDRLPEPPICPTQVWEIVKSMWVREPRDRITIEAIQNQLSTIKSLPDDLLVNNATAPEQVLDGSPEYVYQDVCEEQALNAFRFSQYLSNPQQSGQGQESERHNQNTITLV